MTTTAESPNIRRNTRLLSCAQALGGASPAIVISMGGLVGQMLAGDPGLATLPVSLYNLGLAAGILPAAAMMRRRGRRGGYQLGALLGLLGGLLAAWGIWSGRFALFCTGTALAGLYGAYVQSYRHAVTDGVRPEHRPRAISAIMSAGLVAAVLGTNAAIWTRNLWPAAPFAGSFVSQAALALLALGVVSRLRAVPVGLAAAQAGRPLARIARTPRFIIAAAAGVVSFGLMSLVMTAAPLAMVDCGHSVAAAALGIQWHVLAMYAPSFVTGRLIERFGKLPVTALGLALMLAAAGVSLTGLSVPHFWAVLVLLGVGWNLGFIGATSHAGRLLRAARTPARPGAQRPAGIRLRGRRLVLVRPAAGPWRLVHGQSDGPARRRPAASGLARTQGARLIRRAVAAPGACHRCGKGACPRCGRGALYFSSGGD